MCCMWPVLLLFVWGWLARKGVSVDLGLWWGWVLGVASVWDTGSWGFWGTCFVWALGQGRIAKSLWGLYPQSVLGLCFIRGRGGPPFLCYCLYRCGEVLTLFYSELVFWLRGP